MFAYCADKCVGMIFIQNHELVKVRQLVNRLGKQQFQSKFIITDRRYVQKYMTFPEFVINDICV